jgi:alpha-tubulin suppressor-like RCC1 family protein
MEMGSNLLAVSLGDGKTIVSISGGEGHTCVALNDGTVKCWGWNKAGQLGLGDMMNRGDALSETVDKLPYVSLGTQAAAKSIAAGDHSTCALLSSGSLKCWGENNLGQLGLGDIKPRGDEPDEMGDNLPTVKLF